MNRDRVIIQSMKADNTQLKDQISRQDESYSSLEFAKQELEATREVQVNQITQLQKLYSSEKAHNENLQQEVVSMKTEMQVLLSNKDQLHNEILTASEYILALEDKCFKANKTSLDLLRNFKEAETEIETLKSYNMDLKSRAAFYVPIKTDPIDVKLAEFINNYPDRSKLKVMFIRESEGVYEFGLRKVKVSVQREKILIKVGGGQLSIDEFLDQFTSVELDRLQRKDKLSPIFEQAATQKIVANKSSRLSIDVSPAKRMGELNKSKSGTKRLPSSKTRVATSTTNHARMNSAFIKMLEPTTDQSLKIDMNQDLRTKRHSFTPKREMPIVIGSNTDRTAEKRSALSRT